MRNLFLFLLLFSLTTGSLAQQAAWQSIGIDQGLPDPNVTALAKSGDGRLFVGTAIGLFSYDGFNFQKIGQTNLSPYINKLLISESRLFIGARESASCLDLNSGKIQILKKPMNALGGVIDFYLNPGHDRLYITTSSGVLILDIKGGTFRVFDSIPDSHIRKLRIVNDLEIQAFTLDHTFVKYVKGKRTILYSDKEILDAAWWEKENGWLLVKPDGLFLLNASFENPRKIPLSVRLNTTENVWLYPDRNGGFWVQASGGFFHLPKASVTTPTFYYHENGNPYSFTSSTAQAFFTEPDGTAWVGGDGSGLSYLNNTGGSIRYLTNDETQGQHFWCFSYDPAEHRLFCGTTNGVFLGKLKDEVITERKLLRPPGFNRFSVNAITELNEREYLLSVYREGFWALDKKSLHFRRLDEINTQIRTKFVFGIKPVSDNRLALLTQFNTWFLDKSTMKVSQVGKDQFHNYSIFSFLEDSRKRFLQAGGFGLQIYDSNLSPLDYFARSNTRESLSSDVIFDILEYREGEYLLATMGGGLCLFSDKERSFKKLPLATDPLNIFGILRKTEDQFILTTSGGLCSLNMRTGKSAILNKTNAIPFNDFNQNAFLMTPDWCFTAGEKGILMIRKDKLGSIFSSQNKILVRSNGELVNHLELSPGKHSMNLSLSLENIVPASKLQFAYRIDGIDTGWQFLPYGQNNLVYSYLPSGKYKLEIRLADETGIVDAETVRINLNVIPYFYQTTWFRILTLLLITGIIFLIVRYFALLRLRWKLNRMDAERKVMLERARISRELHDNLGSQLTYLISGLETTGLFLSRNRLDKTAQNLEKMQSAARESIQNLRTSIWALKPGNMTFMALTEECERWITRITEPFEELQVSIIKDPCPDFTIDPLHGLNIFRMVQEAVHNTLKHAAATQLELKIECTGDLALFMVSDNGKGMPESVSEGNGLASLHQRAGELNASISIESEPGKGTRVSIKLEKNTLKG